MDSARSGAAPVDFMAEPEWTSLAADLTHGRIRPTELARLPRPHRDYAYRMVAHLDSPIAVESTQRWYAAAPSGTTAGLVGAAKVRQARRIRGPRLLAELSEDERERHRAILADAESFLLNACARFPDAALPWVPRIDLARGLRLGLDEIRRRHNESQAREPWSFLAAEAAFVGHCTVWAGSYQAMFSFADECRAAPAGHPARCIGALAEAERLLREPRAGLDVMPARELIDLHQEFALFMDAVREPLDPDAVIAVGAFLAVISPRDGGEAALVRRAVTALARRCGGLPYSAAADPLAWFDAVIDAREAEAGAWGAEEARHETPPGA